MKPTNSPQSKAFCLHYWTIFCEIKLTKSLWPSEATCQEKSWSTLVQVIARGYQLPSHYLKQCWLIDDWTIRNKSQTLLTHWGRVPHICVGKTTIIGSDNGLSPGRRQAIIWTNAGILLIVTIGTNFSEILIECHSFSFKKMHMKMSSGKWRPSCLGLNVLTDVWKYCLQNGSHFALASIYWLNSTDSKTKCHD